MHEPFVVWEDARDAAPAADDDQADEYVRLFASRQPSDTPIAGVIDLSSDDTAPARSPSPLPAATPADDFGPSAESIRLALSRFGHASLRGLQEPALRNVFANRDTIVLLPTGGGKSLCFQLPAVMQPGLVVVISPLLALMQDQVLALRNRGIRVEMLCSLVSAKDKRMVLDRMLRDAAFPAARRDRIELLYTTPETLPTEALQAALMALYRKRSLALFAIDEAHCISSWGHDFRPSYLKLGAIRDTFPEVPIMALTATATDRVRVDICSELQLRDDTSELLGDFNRPNISYSVCNKDRLKDDVGALLQFIQRCHKGSVGIVYVHRRLDTEALVEELQTRDETILVAPYHAEISVRQREKTLLDWLAGRIDIICATIAFGMGIDHPAVRFVVHWNMPKSMENLYQESGRAGRDGHASHHVLLYSWDEYARFHKLLQLAEDELRAKERRGVPVNRKRVVSLAERLGRLKKVMDWATQRKCRRKCVLEYFGQQISEDQCGATCDHCSATLLFDKLAKLPSHRPEANTYHYQPGEPRHKWRRPLPNSAAHSGAAGDPLFARATEQVPRYTETKRSAAEVAAAAHDFALNMGTPGLPAPRVATSSVRHGRCEQHVPAGVKTIADYIKATEPKRTAFLRPWVDLEPYNTQDIDDSSDDDDVQRVEPEDALKSSPPPRQRPAKRRRPNGHDWPQEVIVIDDSD